jgi:xylose isomerase
MELSKLQYQAKPKSPAKFIEHMKSFKLAPKFSAGIWCFTPAYSRFHDKYKPDLSITQRLEIAMKLRDCGLKGLEAHYPNEINEENAHIWKQFEKDSGIKLITVIPSLFSDKKFEFGALSNPINERRREAIDLFKRALAMNIDMNTEFAIVWPGIEGYENPFGIDFSKFRKRFVQGLAEGMDAVPGVRLAIEPKPYEPRGHMIFGTSPEGMILCHQVESLLKNPQNRKILAGGEALCCLNIEVGHAMMAFEDLPYSYSWPLSEGRMAHMHLNSQPMGNYDQDLNVGVISPEQMDAMMYVLKMHGYREWFGLDINPERMPIDTAIKINIDAVLAANDRINDIDHESVSYAVNHPDRARGWLEAYLIRARARHVEKLPPLPPIKPTI